jgi:NAD(P)-dependent dehydrogenase (short-subunit alcohol dehydrogenase family)
MPVALVTGCSSGFGEAIAVAFAQRGYQVVATMRKPGSAPPSLKILAAEKSAAIIIAPLDVTKPVM